jgi:hypothetical protein
VLGHAALRDVLVAVVAKAVAVAAAAEAAELEASATLTVDPAPVGVEDHVGSVLDTVILDLIPGTQPWPPLW